MASPISHDVFSLHLQGSDGLGLPAAYLPATSLPPLSHLQHFVLLPTCPQASLGAWLPFLSPLVISSSIMFLVLSSMQMTTKSCYINPASLPSRRPMPMSNVVERDRKLELKSNEMTGEESECCTGRFFSAPVASKPL